MKRQEKLCAGRECDGSFLVDSVPPGSCSLKLNASPTGKRSVRWKAGRPTLTRTTELTVPDNPDPLVPIEMGEIILSAPAKRSPQARLRAVRWSGIKQPIVLKSRKR